jgi:hypothetical protein
MTQSDAIPEPPNELADSGRKLWVDILEQYELDSHELLILKEACRVADRLDLLAEAAAGEPLTRISNKTGDPVANPLLVEARQQSITLARLTAALRLPTEDLGNRPQRRSGVRGVYQPRSAWRTGT